MRIVNQVILLITAIICATVATIKSTKMWTVRDSSKRVRMIGARAFGKSVRFSW